MMAAGDYGGGTRLIEFDHYGRWEMTTFLGALRSTDFKAQVCVDGPFNGRVSLARIFSTRSLLLEP